MTTMKLVTIIAEPVLREEILAELKTLGATGFTTTACEGEGTRQLHAAELPSDRIKIETLVPTELVEKALARIDQRFFRDYEIIAYVSEVQVVRGSKFAEQKRA
jgi:nitrogen regulatory protein P-II 2